ncbi:MAG: VOC family protein [Mycetocola sp.]
MGLSLNFIGLVARDLDATLAFYRALGLDVPEREDDQVHVEVRLPSGIVLAWDTVETIQSFDPDFVPGSGGHRAALAFECGSVEELNGVYSALVSAGHHGQVEPWDAPWGQRYATLHDPDGTAVDLYVQL